LALTPGTRLGVYEVTALLGEGGMGQVYRATDTKLKRQVAIKILPPSVAADHDRLARFQREAEVLASLNHPNIAGIYGLEESDGIKALVMELVEGPTLADRIAQGPIPLDESLPIASQIAEALEAAHERGIIHRDLKPFNVKVRPDDIVKVLDFGLAKALELVSSDGTDATASPTITSPAMMTRIGVILGTAAYMSPEQAKGRAADKRSDVWAFGCVLYEMVTGRRAFEGEDVSDTLAAVLRGEPDWTAVPEATPSPVVRLLRQCLEKDPKQRRRDIADVRLDLNDAARYAATIPMIGGNQAFGRARRRGLLVYGVPALVLGATIATVLSYALRPPDPIDAAEPIELSILPPPGTSFPLEAGAPWPSISPDGRQLAFVAVSAARVQQLWIRPLESATARPLARSEGAARPFWSADSGAIGFFADGKISASISRTARRRSCAMCRILEECRPRGVRTA